MENLSRNPGNSVSETQLYSPEPSLGKWMDAYNTEYQWNWQICSQTYTLLQNLDGHGLHLPHRGNSQPTYIVYWLHASQASSPCNTVPVTPILLSMSHKVTLPVSVIDQPEQPA